MQAIEVGRIRNLRISASGRQKRFRKLPFFVRRAAAYRGKPMQRHRVPYHARRIVAVSVRALNRVDRAILFCIARVIIGLYRHANGSHRIFDELHRRHKSTPGVSDSHQSSMYARPSP